MSTDAEVGGGDGAAVGGNQSALDRILQLPYVARQRGQMNAEDREPIIQVRAKRAGFDPMLEITVRGGDQPDIGPQRRGAAHPLVLPFLKHAEELRLDGRSQITDLVEEERAARRELEATALETIRA